jgi:hypothetical protein
MTAYRPYTAVSAINTPIPVPAPVHPGSPKMISKANYWLLGGTAQDADKEFLGPRQRLSYYRGDTSKLTKVAVYANNNGWVGAGPFQAPMPTWMASVVGPTCQKGDSNVVIVDSITGDVWEMWHTTPPGYTPRTAGKPSNRWNCDEYRHWPASTVSSKGYGPPSTSYQPGTSGSKIQLTAGLLVPEDFTDCFSGSDPGTVIPHRLRLDSYCGSSGANFPKNVLPAYAGDGRQSYGIPAGGVVQLDPAINVATWPSVNAKPEPWRSALKKILRTLQVYGIMQVDSYPGPGGGDIDCIGPGSAAEGGVTYPKGYKFPWEVAGVGWSYKNGVPYDLMPHFRVIDWTKWTGA